MALLTTSFSLSLHALLGSPFSLKYCLAFSASTGMPSEVAPCAELMASITAALADSKQMLGAERV